jgi:hypothetical protein
LTKKAPYKGLGADSEEKREPVSDIDTAVVDSLKALDPNRPIREADIARSLNDLCLGPSPAAFQCARLSWYEPFPERLGGAMRRRKFINLNRFWNNPAATTLVLS